MYIYKLEFSGRASRGLNSSKNWSCAYNARELSTTTTSDNKAKALVGFPFRLPPSALGRRRWEIPPTHTNTNNDQNPFSPSQHHHFDTLGLSSGFFTFLNTGSLCRRMSAPINGFPFFCTATCPQKLVIFSSLKDSGSSCGAHFFVVQDMRFIVFSLCISSLCLSYLNVGQAQSKNYWLVWKMEHPRRQSALRELVAALSKLPVHSKTWACPK